MAKLIKSVKCLLCGWHHPIIRTGSKRLLRGESVDQPKGAFLFNKVNPNESAFISVRECKGRGGGLPQVEKVTLREAMAGPEYKDLIDSLRNQSYQILKILSE
jgi:hypothetical protein